MKEKKVVYYNSLGDDFAGTHIKTVKVGTDYKYIHKNIFWRIQESFLYYVIARPAVAVICRHRFGLKIKNRKAIRRLGKKGFFLYGNHTQILDVFIPHIVGFPHKVYTVAHPDSVSLPGIRTLVQMLGALPVPSSIRGLENLREAVDLRCRGGGCIAIYPEAHIWPYYTGIRPFGRESFSFPVNEDAPVVAMVTTYRRRTRFGKEIRPGWTIHVSDAFHPETGIPPREAQEKLRGQVYDYMRRISDGENYEYIRYEAAEKSAAV